MSGRGDSCVANLADKPGWPRTDCRNESYHAGICSRERTFGRAVDTSHTTDGKNRAAVSGRGGPFSNRSRGKSTLPSRHCGLGKFAIQDLPFCRLQELRHDEKRRLYVRKGGDGSGFARFKD
jgi:hypothetical protein